MPRYLGRDDYRQTSSKRSSPTYVRDGAKNCTAADPGEPSQGGIGARVCMQGRGDGA